ncbi:isocitrate lyase/PEP mutase family protein [Oceaniglobus indicus]|uniref:isocitrate lyase/PEP mutase family protein n=1 Tax=Oceaniglobus indicus TaxID=2047749 RepID=UPI001F4EE304|nr:isocitrate lyase/phosphoenolpyruvate mutase family protein [Oceaniglobus indicus]
MTRDPGAAFRALHVPGDPFILANAWDLGSAKMLVGLGARAIATSSAAHGFTLGRPDGQVSRDEALAHAETLVATVDVPVSGDFENGWGDTPDDAAETVRLAGEIGLAGCSIEDVTAGGAAVYDFDLAVEKIAAAVAAARALPRDFVLCARADGVMTGAYDLPEALRRIRAFADAGADCLYVPIPGDLAALAQVCAATDRPVNALAAGPLMQASRADMAAAGVARISLGSSLARATHRVIEDAGRAMFQRGDFSAMKVMGGADVDRYLG